MWIPVCSIPATARLNLSASVTCGNIHKVLFASPPSRHIAHSIDITGMAPRDYQPARTTERIRKNVSHIFASGNWSSLRVIRLMKGDVSVKDLCPLCQWDHGTTSLGSGSGWRLSTWARLGGPPSYEHTVVMCTPGKNGKNLVHKLEKIFKMYQIDGQFPI